MAEEHSTSAAARLSPDTVSSRVMLDLLAYQTNFWQRSVRYLDTLRRGANNMLEYERAEIPGSCSPQPDSACCPTEVR